MHDDARVSSGVGRGVTRRHALAALAGAATLAANRATAAPTSAAPAAVQLIAAAMAQIGVTTIYDPSYQRLLFPGGDVPADRGVCTDVIVRAYRSAFGFDLQAKLNVDMRAHGAAYPKRWGAGAPDANIDHRRVPNLQAFLTRQGAALPVPAVAGGWLPGDLVTQLVPPGLSHIGIVSAASNAQGTRPLIVHNIGRGTQLEDVLDAFAITGRYRFLPAATAG